MSVSVEALGIDKLSVPEKLSLIEQIWNTLPEQIDPSEIPPWHLAELTRRRAAAATEPGVGRPWREALDAIESKSRFIACGFRCRSFDYTER